MLVKIFLAAAVMLGSAAASAVGARDPRNFHEDIAPRGEWYPPMPKAPSLRKPECQEKEPTGEVKQVTACSSGAPYCCTSDGNGGQLCSNSTEICSSTIICCNNQNGFQMCIGSIDFNAPVTINVVNIGCPDGKNNGKKKGGKREAITPTITK